MSHPEIQNRTPYAFEALFLVDEEFRPLIVPVVKGTFTIVRNRRCERAEAQIPVNTGGEYWGPDPVKSSYKYEPEVAFSKPTTDVVLIGNAYAPRRGATETHVALRVGPVSKEAIVYGDRTWFGSGSVVSLTRPVPFEKIPLQYERAFGGWDRRDPDPSKQTYEPRNPVGMGFVGRAGFEKELRAPNIEDPRSPVRSLSDRPAPAGFGFTSPHWQPRAALAGTFDEAWQKSRSPLLPRDFDRRHLNAASPGLIAPQYLKGDEPVAMVGATPEGTLNFTLPGVAPPAVRVVLAGEAAKEVALALDTIIIEPDERRVQILWRGNLALRTGPHDVRSVEVTEAGISG